MGNYFITQKEIQTLLLGLHGVGKATILQFLRTQSNIPPVVGYAFDSLRYKNLSFIAWDAELNLHQSKIRPLLKHYLTSADAIVFVVDCTDRARLGEAKDAFWSVLDDEELVGKEEVKILVLVNKMDRSDNNNNNTLTISEVTTGLELYNMNRRREKPWPWFIQPCSAVSGEGLTDGIEWLYKQFNN